MKTQYQVLFFTHTGAIKFDRKMKAEKISCELMPVPRTLSSNCGVSARILLDGDVNRLIDDQIETIFQNNNDEYTLIYNGTK
jgi:hypothetical protein